MDAVVPVRHGFVRTSVPRLVSYNQIEVLHGKTYQHRGGHAYGSTHRRRIAQSSPVAEAFPLFAGLTEAQLDHIAKMAVRRKVPRHSTIVHVGDCIDALYVIVSGGAKVLNRDATGAR
jgi:hypothetical protein